jgi:predicted glycoside hydrolase/deacetylase ChbG (UPF0249 family)
MRRLIINADDLGADEARNAGIFEAILAGAVTSASILPNGPGLLDALNRIHSGSFKNVSWGVHLNLSEGNPVSIESARLLAPNGIFLGKVSSQRLLMRQGDYDLETEISHEIDAQISLLKTSGIPLSHLDGHQHVHVFPAILRAMIMAAQRHHIPWIRIPDEPEPTSLDFPLPSSLCEEARLFSGLGQTARSILLESGLHTPDHFRGLYLKGGLSIRGLESVLQWLPDGLTELMVHPGRFVENPPETPFSIFSTAEREQELETLLNAKLRLILKEMEITLTPFPETLY